MKTLTIENSADLAKALASIKGAFVKRTKVPILTNVLIREVAGGLGDFAPMLAQTYERWPGRTCYSQPKLDGVRCLANSAGLWTRNGRSITSCPHVIEALATFFKRFPDITLDGELYRHSACSNFAKIASAVRRAAPSFEASLVQYHVFDGDFPRPFGRRSGLINQHGPNPYNAAVRIVETREVRSEYDLNKEYDRLIALGYEGQMVRLDEYYEHGRSPMLLKRKPFQDAEFEISAIGEGQGQWAGCAKFVEFVLPGDRLTNAGERPRAGVAGTKDFARRILAEAHKYKRATVQYNGLTPSGIPRFPIVTTFHEDERI